ncbi:hypothetical protein O2K51_01810 [Apibacter raozihei]|uniref:hypothetical protein n=2 Tax=Apibacter TaxID=1778601 RepID=UPI000FEC1804|nr:hypothetical protein [Apibacter sp. HY039]
MKLQTKQTKSKITIVNIILLIIFFTSFFFSYMDIQVMEKNDEIICFVSFILLIYLSYLGCSFFRYDSGGETLILQNQKALPFSFLVKETQSDFPKRKLVNYKVVNKFLFKRKLEIYITSKRVSSGMTKISFDISYLSSKEVKNLKISLDKVMKENSQYQDALNV